jgi:hypothetical protein
MRLSHSVKTLVLPCTAINKAEAIDIGTNAVGCCACM